MTIGRGGSELADNAGSTPDKLAVSSGDVLQPPPVINLEEMFEPVDFEELVAPFAAMNPPVSGRPIAANEATEIIMEPRRHRVNQLLQVHGIVLLVGAPRVGKSSLVKSIADKVDGAIVVDEGDVPYLLEDFEEEDSPMVIVEEINERRALDCSIVSLCASCRQSNTPLILTTHLVELDHYRSLLEENDVVFGEYVLGIPSSDELLAYASRVSGLSSDHPLVRCICEVSGNSLLHVNAIVGELVGYAKDRKKGVRERPAYEVVRVTMKGLNHVVHRWEEVRAMNSEDFANIVPSVPKIE